MPLMGALVYLKSLPTVKFGDGTTAQDRSYPNGYLEYSGVLRLMFGTISVNGAQS
jgi:hypothetical protein